MKKLLSIVDSNGVQQKTVITESVSVPTVSKTEQYFKAVNNEVLQNINEQRAQKKIEVKRVVSRVLEKLEEGKTTKDKPAVRNFVAKNAPKAGAGAHKDKKKAEKQGDIKHKKELVPMDEERTEVKDKDGNVTSWKDEGEWKKSTAKKDGRGKVTNLSDKARRETEKLSKKEKELAENDMASFFKNLQQTDPKFKNLRIHGDPDHDKLRQQDADDRNARRAADVAKADDAKAQDHANLGNLEAEYKKMKAEYEALGGSNWQYADREQNLSDRERKARSMEHGLNALANRIHHAKKHGQISESTYGDIKVGSPVKVYSNVLKKSVFGKVVNLKEGRAYVQYNNTKIVMGHPINEVAVAAPAAKVATSVGGKMASRLIPGVGAAVGAYDAYDRAKKGDYIGAGLSGLGAVTSFIPGIGTAATMGLAGAQLARDYKVKTGAFAPDEAEAGQAATPAAGKGTIPNPTKYPTTDAEIKAFQQSKGLTVDGKIGPKTQAALDAAGLKKPAQAATPSPGLPSRVAAAARSVAPAASAIAQQSMK